MGSYAWIPASNGSIPPTAVAAGKDVDGSILYAGRAFHEGDLLPAKISPSQGAALVAYGSSEHKVYNYEVTELLEKSDQHQVPTQFRISYTV